MDLRPYKLMTWTIPDDSVYEPEKVRPSTSSSSGSLCSDFLNFCPNHFSTHAPVSEFIITQPLIGPFFIVLAAEDDPAASRQSSLMRRCKTLLLPSKRVRPYFSSLLRSQEPGQAHSHQRRSNRGLSNAPFQISAVCTWRRHFCRSFKFTGFSGPGT